MIQNFVIYFFGFFLTSRVFSEMFRLLPKWVDVFDIPFIGVLTFFSFFRSPSKNIDYEEHKYFFRSVFALCLIMFISSLVNYKEFFEPAALLFAIGILQGPLLFLFLNKFIDDVESFAARVNRILFIIFGINIFVVIFLDIPMFISTRDPDVVSGTFGLNPYQFSIFLIICAGLTLGNFELLKAGKILLIVAQIFIFVTFFLLQYLAGLPFFIFSYAMMMIALFGRRIARTVFVGSIVFLVCINIIFFVLGKAEERSVLKYDNWFYIFKDPGKFLKYGKFQSYPQTFKMITRDPLTALIGVGPGNYTSRAFNTFGGEIKTYKKRKKGVGNLIKKLFGLSSPRITSTRKKYLGTINTGMVLGTYQLSSPNSSLLAPIAETGLLGGGILIAMYMYLLMKSLKLIKLAREYARNYLPLSTALVGCIFYVIGLAFLDNYWEMSRATLPLWLLFWTVNAGIYLKLQNSLRTKNSENSEDNKAISD